VAQAGSNSLSTNQFISVQDAFVVSLFDETMHRSSELAPPPFSGHGPRGGSGGSGSGSGAPTPYPSGVPTAAALGRSGSPNPTPGSPLVLTVSVPETPGPPTGPLSPTVRPRRVRVYLCLCLITCIHVYMCVHVGGCVLVRVCVYRCLCGWVRGTDGAERAHRSLGTTWQPHDGHARPAAPSCKRV
jgi:hypothetical protein